MKQRSIAGICLLAVATCHLSCSPVRAFEKKFKRVSEGMLAPQVIAILGEPDGRSTKSIPKENTRTPVMMLKQFLSPGTEYAEWTYLRGDMRYLVWLSSEYPKPGGKLAVILKSSYPADAVF